jgi:WD40 repeat protein
MAPEQINDAKSVGPPADVFALGTILYECLTGSAAFGGDSSHARIAAIATGSFTSIRKLRPEVPRWLARAIERAFTARIEDRWSDGAAFARGLETRDAGRRGAAPIVGLVSVAALAAAGIGAALAWRGSRTLTPPAEPRAQSATAALAAMPSAPPGEPRGLAPCRRFLKTRYTRLEQPTLGRYDLKHLMGTGAVALSPDGKLAASGSYDGVLELWSLDHLGDAQPTVDQLRSQDAHPGGTDALAFTHDGRLILSGGADKKVKVWEVGSGKLVRELSGHADAIVSIAVLPDGHRFATASFDRSIRLWDLATGSQVKAFAGHAKRAFTVAPSPDRPLVASTSEDGTIRLWDVSTSSRDTPVVLKVPPTSSGQPECYSAAWSPDGSTLATSSGDGTILLWDTTTWQPKTTLRGHEAGVWPVTFVGRGLRLLSAGFDRSVRIWNLADASSKKLGEHDCVIGLAVSPDGRYALSSGYEHCLRAWDLDHREEIDLASGHSDAVLAVSAEGRSIVTGSADRTARVWDAGSGRELRLLPGHDAAVTAVGCAAGGRFAVTGSADGKLRFFDLSTGALVHALDAHEGRVVSACVWRESVVLSIGEDGACRTWEVASGDTRTFAKVATPGASIGLPPLDPGSPSLGNAVAADGTGTVRVFEIGTSDVYRTFNGPEDPASAAVYMPVRPSRLLIGGRDGTVRVVDVDTSREVARASVHAGAVESIAVASDGKLAVTCGADRAVRLVRLPSCEAIDRIDLATSSDVPRAVAFLPGDRSFVVATGRGVALRFALAADAR